MNDFLGYMRYDPVYGGAHHDELTFSMVYAYSEKFLLSLSHDEVVHGKGTLFNKMPGTPEQKFGNLRAAYGYMAAHPGKKLLFMGQEFGQEPEWSEKARTGLAGTSGGGASSDADILQALVKLYRSHPRCMGWIFHRRALNGLIVWNGRRIF